MKQRVNANSLIIICGPTGVGKSQLAVELAREDKGEIVSADAGQVYQGFDIGTAKPRASEQAQITHHCIDLWAPDIQSDAMRWVAAADAAINDIHERGKTPFVVGGTGLYLRALIHGVFPSPDPDPKLRQKLQDAFDREGGEALHQRLKKIDPESGNKIHPNDSVRLIRALEYFEQTGKRISEERDKHQFQENRYEAHWIGLNRDREQLYQGINARVEQMMAAGWRDEAASLYKEWGGEVPAFQMIGYRQLKEVFAGDLAPDQLIPSIQQASRHYAKRQLTWFRADSAIQWFDVANGLEQLVPRLQSRFLGP